MILIKRNKIIVGILVLCMIVISGTFKANLGNGYKFTVINNTDKTLEDLEIRYKTDGMIQNIAKIQPKDSWKYTLDTNSI